MSPGPPARGVDADADLVADARSELEAEERASRYGRSRSADRPPLPDRVRVAARDGVSALRLLRERAWIGALIGVILLSVVFVLLGRWQYHRHVTRSAKNDLITSNFAAAPAELDQLLPGVDHDPGVRVPAVLQWRSARMSGHYLPQDTVLIRNRPYSTGANDSRNGYEVVVPFALDAGPVVLINRGWIPAGGSAAQGPGTVPAPPAGDVRVVARLRPSEPVSSKQAPAGQAVRINAADLATRLPAPLDQRVVGGFATLVSESPPAPGATPSELDPPDPGIGINLAYAVQWLLFAGAAYVLLAVAGIKEVRRRALGGLIARR